MMRSLVLIAHNLRSSHNIGSLLRTAEGLGVSKVFLTGYSPYPQHDNDERLPHIAKKVDYQIAKTALGAERLVKWEYFPGIDALLDDLKAQGYTLAALEQTPDSVQLPNYKPSEKLAIIVGREVEGLENEIISRCDLALEIPMLGKKESFNVVQAAAMALYHCRFTT
jgi:23S rRNA (guanosine2251-2'-O)-methyltransferase